MNAEPSHFYAIGVGPGAPDLVTVRAAKLIASADVVIAPCSEKADDSLALETVRTYLTPQQEVVRHVYPMRRDDAATRACWGQMAQQTAAWCESGKSVVQITIGDPMIYSTSAYLLEALEGRLGCNRIHVVPGISAYQAAAAKCAELLCLQEDRLMLMPATDLAEVERALDHAEMLVLYKAGRRIAELKQLLRKKGLLSQTRFAFYVEQEGRETIWQDAEAMGDELPGYMATVLIRIGSRGWHPSGHAVARSIAPVGEGQ